MTALSKKGKNARQGDGDQRAFCNDDGDGDGSENVKKGRTVHVESCFYSN